MIAYRDFVPTQISPAALFKSAKYESLDHTLETANAWIRTNSINVLNVETVVLPNLCWSEGTADTKNFVLQTAVAEATKNQFFRVWYRVG